MVFILDLGIGVSCCGNSSCGSALIGVLTGSGLWVRAVLCWVVGWDLFWVACASGGGGGGILELLIGGGGGGIPEGGGGTGGGGIPEGIDEGGAGAGGIPDETGATGDKGPPDDECFRPVALVLTSQRQCGHVSFCTLFARKSRFESSRFSSNVAR